MQLLQELTQTMLIHANKRCPRVITTDLQPHAMRMANDVLNKMPNLQDKQHQTVQQMFSKTRAHTNPKHWKPFGCPAHVLGSKLQDGKHSTNGKKDPR